MTSSKIREKKKKKKKALGQAENPARQQTVWQTYVTSRLMSNTTGEYNIQHTALLPLNTLMTLTLTFNPSIYFSWVELNPMAYGVFINVSSGYYCLANIPNIKKSDLIPLLKMFLTPDNMGLVFAPRWCKGITLPLNYLQKILDSYVALKTTRALYMCWKQLTTNGKCPWHLLVRLGVSVSDREWMRVWFVSAAIIWDKLPI